MVEQCSHNVVVLYTMLYHVERVVFTMLEQYFDNTLNENGTVLYAMLEHS